MKQAATISITSSQWPRLNTYIFWYCTGNKFQSKYAFPESTRFWPKIPHHPWPQQRIGNNTMANNTRPRPLQVDSRLITHHRPPERKDQKRMLRFVLSRSGIHAICMSMEEEQHPQDTHHRLCSLFTRINFEQRFLSFLKLSTIVFFVAL